MAKVQESQEKIGQSYFNLCKKEAQNALESIIKVLRKYVEDVCLAYLLDENVVIRFQSKFTGIFRGFKTDTLSKEQEQKYLNSIRNDFNQLINNIISQGLSTSTNLTDYNDKIIGIFEPSDLFKHYDSANYIEKLREKVKKIYD